MIEVIYDEEKNTVKDTRKNGEAENDNKKESQKTQRKLPKNIRQIGTASGNKRIYIEDYVVTYLNYIARPGSTLARGAILLGEQASTEVGEAIFISGAVDAQNLEFDMDESEFTQEAWAEIYEKVKEYFPELSVVGWFLSRMGFSTAINDKIEKMHVDNFPGKDKVLFVTDSIECEDAFYMYEHGQLVKQKGYFIYYTKNEAMQNYIVNQKVGGTEEENSEIKRKDSELIRNYREKNKTIEPQKESGISIVYVASAFVVLAMLAMGITVVSNYDRMKEMEVSINRLELTADQQNGQEDALADAMAKVTAEDIRIETPSTVEGFDTYESGSFGINDVNESDISNNDNDRSDGDILNENSSENNTENDSVPTMVDSETAYPEKAPESYYIIQYGDSLMSISEKKYGTIAYAEKIAEINNMDMDDPIYEGQKILLPDM